MFIGHFAAGFAAKAAAPRISLGTLFLAAQFIDLLWPTLLLLGVERVRIVPGATAVTPLVFDHYPVSHSLVAFLALAHAANLAGPPPPSVEAIAWAGQLQWLLVVGGYWIDRHRRAGADPPLARTVNGGAVR